MDHTGPFLIGVAITDYNPFTTRGGEPAPPQSWAFSDDDRLGQGWRLDELEPDMAAQRTTKQRAFRTATPIFPACRRNADGAFLKLRKPCAEACSE